MQLSVTWIIFIDIKGSKDKEKGGFISYYFFALLIRRQYLLILKCEVRSSLQIEFPRVAEKSTPLKCHER